jgi:hypothetical protein
MYGKYLYALEKNYNYKGNWRPDQPIKVGSCFPYKTGFTEWLKSCFGISQAKVINESLCNYSNEVIKDLSTKTIPLTIDNITRGVERSVKADISEIEFAAAQDGGFIISLSDAYEERIDDENLIAKLKTIPAFAKNEAIAVITGVTYACGMITVFNKSNSKIALKGEIPLISELSIPYGSMDVASKSGDCIVFKSDDKDKPLMPFIDVFIYQPRQTKELMGGVRDNEEIKASKFTYEGFIDLYGGIDDLFV